ncbi:amino acid ABC transporter permease [Alkaliphilus hydrothermalis]|uniref:Polar amino acid transport system permease protein n=1 Tax=Alkaliphilus hydrothermalis TaxID=1482730 RepID=A0ABS2NS54_9FIRM|nr:amino acid ABC transporter permease [Alkaliphilus hydrothermalis]MBM7615702.1 polar amino acid transport system permease protein [Alkaliphilus hydrothermalis]
MDLEFITTYYQFFLSGTINTVLLAFFSVLGGTMVGVILALMKLSEKKPVKFLASAYIEFVRGTPLLVQLFLIYYGLPHIGIDLPDMVAGIFAVSLNSGAYVAEIIRGGIQSIDKGQMEAGRSLGMSYKMTMKEVIIPQAFKNILPALGNEFIVIIKESAIVSVIGIHELMYKTDVVRGITYKPFTPLIVAAIIYFVLTFSISKFLGIAERSMRASD